MNRKMENPCADCVNGYCDMNCGPSIDPNKEAFDSIRAAHKIASGHAKLTLELATPERGEDKLPPWSDSCVLNCLNAPSKKLEIQLEDRERQLLAALKENARLTAMLPTAKAIGPEYLRASREHFKSAPGWHPGDEQVEANIVDPFYVTNYAELLQAREEIAQLKGLFLVARPVEEWHEDFGYAIWWKFPVEEPPYVGSPECDDWPGYHTHFVQLRNESIPVPRSGLARLRGEK